MISDAQLPYDRTSTGWDLAGGREHRIRAAELRQRCGEYTVPDGSRHWGDHRVTLPGSTCVDVDCHVAHHPDELPGWPEHMPGYHDREGVQPVAAALYGWDAAGMLRDGLGDTLAWAAAHVALDALRDAGYEIVRRKP